ncbi:MAG: GNAT family N-acetyltransferase [Bacteroidota bacterium]|nr:GNAT family N-acetyltransferase [Bacteroidota bacterium]
MVKIKTVKIDSTRAHELSELAIKIYKENFLHLWYDGGAEWYMKKSYAPEVVAEELIDPNNLHYIAYDNEQPVAYLKIRLNESLINFESKNCLEVERIYILNAFKGVGLGKMLMQIADDLALDLKKDIVFLKAMDSSTDPIAFYNKLGYEICGTLTLPFEHMKVEYRGMVIMKKDLDKSA